MSAQESFAALINAINKLTHPLAEVRCRAVQSLDFKLTHKLLSLDNLGQDRTVLKNFLGCLQYDDNGASTDITLLVLLSKVAATHGAARQLLHLGAEQLLLQLQRTRSSDVQSAASHTLAAILSGPQPAISMTSNPSLLALPSSIAIPDYVTSQSHKGSSSSALHRHAPTPAFTYPQPRSDHATARPSGIGSTARAGGAWDTPASVTSHISNTRQPHVTNSALDRSRQLPVTDTSQTQRTATTTAAAVACARDWVLHSVPVGETDDQDLFELSLRLKYVEDARITLPALIQLHSAALVDVPAEAVAFRHDILTHLLSILTSNNAGMELVSLAAQCLLRIIVGLKRSLLLATDPMYNTPTTPHANDPTITTTTTNGGHGSGGFTSTVFVPTGLDEFGAPAKTNPTDFSVSSSTDSFAASQQRHHPFNQQQQHSQQYQSGTSTPAGVALDGSGHQVMQGPQHEPWQGLLPQPLLLPNGGAAAEMASHHRKTHQSSRGEVVNVSQLVYQVALQVFDALRDPLRLFALAPLAMELVPLLLLGRDGGPPTASEHEKLKWTQLLRVLSRTLLANLSMAHAESPPIVQAFLRDARDNSCPLPPVLNAPTAAVLALSGRLAAALPREFWTPEVVPAALTDRLAAVVRDDVLSALLRGFRGALVPLLTVLRPDVAVVLDVAAAGEAALSAGDALVRQVPLLMSPGGVSPAAWLQQLQNALPALQLPQQEALLEGILTGLAYLCGGSSSNKSRASSGGSSGGGGDRTAHSSHGRSPGSSPWQHSAARGPQEGDAEMEMEQHGGGGERRGPCGAGVTAAAAATAGVTESSWVEQAEELFLTLLSHGSPNVAMTCYGLLEALVQQARAQPGHPLPRVLARKTILEHLVVRGLADERARRPVARILLCIMSDAAILTRVQSWACWVRLYESDPQVGAASAALAAGTQLLTPDPHSWAWLSGVLGDLYHCDAERRRSAAFQLSSALLNMGVFMSEDEPHCADPFRVCLDNGARDDLVVPVANPRLARSFRPADVTNLLAILANTELALELRRSAAEQLLALAAEERLREVLEEPANLHIIACVAALRDPASGQALSSSQAGCLAATGLSPPTPDILSTLDVQLPLAAVNLLFVLAAHSPTVRAWLRSESPTPSDGPPAPAPMSESRTAAREYHNRSGDSGGSGVAGILCGEAPHARGGGHLSGEGLGMGLELLASGVLPMVFHSMMTVRRGVARLLAALRFGSEADRWSAWPRVASCGGAVGGEPAGGQHSMSSAGGAVAAGGQSGGGGGTGSCGDVTRLPAPFQSCYRFPCRVTWVGIPPVSETGKQRALGLEGKPRLQDLVLEQQQLVVLLIQERLAMRAAGGDPARLLALVNERPDCLGGLKPAALHILAASIRAVSPGGGVSRCLGGVRAATSHAECSTALRNLQMVCSTRPGILAFAASDWQVHFENLLASSPVSSEDKSLWVELLEPMLRALATDVMTEPQLTQLASYLRQSALPLLSAPDAAADPPGLPLALAGSSAAQEAVGGRPEAHCHLVCTQTVLATVVELARSARLRLPLPQALRILLALSPTQLLQLVAEGYVANTAANYGCRVLALQLLLEVTSLLAAAAHDADAARVCALYPGLRAALLTCLQALLEALSSGGLTVGAAGGPLQLVTHHPGAGRGGGARSGATGNGAGGGGGAAAAISARSSLAAAERCGDRNTAGAGGGGSGGDGGGGGFAGKGAVRLALQCVLFLTRLIPAAEWSDIWQQLSGSFWVSRLLRDRDCRLRVLAAELLAQLLQPGAAATHVMVIQGWPDAVKSMAKIAVDRAAPYALRTAALQVLGCGLALQEADQDRAAARTPGPTDPDPPDSRPRRQLFASLTSLPPAIQLLQHPTLWSQLPALIREPLAPQPFLAAALALMLQRVIQDGESASELLKPPGLLDALLQLLEQPPRSSSGATRVGGVPAPVSVAVAANVDCMGAGVGVGGGGLGGVCKGAGVGSSSHSHSSHNHSGSSSSNERVAVLRLMVGCWEAADSGNSSSNHSMSHLEGGEGVGAVAASHAAGVAAAAAVGLVITPLTASGGGAAGACAGSGRAWCSNWSCIDIAIGVMLERCPGLDPCARSREELLTGPVAPLADPTRFRAHLAALRCTALVAQLLGHTQQDPPLLPLDVLGHAPPEVAARLLVAFARLAAAAGVGVTAGGYTVQQAAETRVRLEAALQAAAAANAVLQLLVDEPSVADQAVASADTSLSRTSGRPLLTVCAEVLLSSNSPRALRLAIVCLVATLLARKHAAVRLLHFEGTDNEYLVASSGQEVGADLCSALMELLPPHVFTLSPHPATSSSAATEPPLHGMRARLLASPPPPPAPSTASSWGQISSSPAAAPAHAQPHPHHGLHFRASPEHTSGLVAAAANARHSAAAAGAVFPVGSLGSSAGGIMGGAGGHELRVADLCVIVALRNLLAFSQGAKTAALQAGYHRALMQAASSTTGAMAAATAATAATSAGTSTPKKSAASGRGGPRDRKGAPQPAGNNSSAAPGRGVSQAGGARRGSSGMDRTSHAPSPGAVEPYSPMSHGALTESGQPPAPPPSSASLQMPDVSVSPLQQGAGVAAGRAVGAGDVKAAARRAAEQKVVAALSLLKHLALGSPTSRQHLIRDGTMAALRGLWPTAAATTAGPLFHELLGCLANMLPGCPEARARMAVEASGGGGGSGSCGSGGVMDIAGGGGGGANTTGGSGTLLGHLLGCLFGTPRLETPTFSLAVGVLQHLAAAEDGAALLLKSPFLASCQKALQDTAQGGGGSSVRMTRDGPRQVAWLQVLTSLAAWPEGQRALLRSSSGPGILELIVRLIAPTTLSGEGTSTAAAMGGSASNAYPQPSQPQSQPQPQTQQLLAQMRNAALALIRNLCFATEAKTHLLANPVVLPALVAAAEGVVGNAQGAAYAASGLWALTHQGEKVKAALRRVPSAPQRLVAALAACRFHESQRTKVSDVSAGAVGASDRAAGAPGVGGGGLLGLHAEGGRRSEFEWMQLASSQLTGLLETLQATAGGAGERGEGRTGDQSPMRDQDRGARRGAGR